MAFFTDTMPLAVRNGTVLATAGHKSAADSYVYLTVVKDLLDLLASSWDSL